MGKLSASLIEEYFAIHLPYRTRILLAHYRMTRVPWHGDRAQLEAAFEASLITGRMYLNVVGVSKNRQDVLVPSRPQADDVSAVDLGGTFVDIGALTTDDVALLTRFIKMADKGAAHLTMPMPHPVDQTHIASRGYVDWSKLIFTMRPAGSLRWRSRGRIPAARDYSTSPSFPRRQHTLSSSKALLNFGPIRTRLRPIKTT